MTRNVCLRDTRLSRWDQPEDDLTSARQNWSRARRIYLYTMIPTMIAWGGAGRIIQLATERWYWCRDWRKAFIYTYIKLVSKFCIIFAVKVDTRLLGLSLSVTWARTHVQPSAAFADLRKNAWREKRKKLSYKYPTTSHGVSFIYCTFQGFYNSF